MTSYADDHDAIVRTMQYYIDGCRTGKSHLMRPGFHADARLVGYFGGELYYSPIQVLFEWIDANGPAPDIEPRFASIEIVETIAVVRLEVERWSGALAGSDVHMSDLFMLLKTDAGWQITQKMFHVHAQ